MIKDVSIACKKKIACGSGLNLAILDTINDGLFTFQFFPLVPDKEAVQKKLPKTRKKFQFYVYSPEHDKECEAVKVISLLIFLAL